MKRKTENGGLDHNNDLPHAKKRVLSDDVAISRFRKGLFEPSELDKYTKEYAASAPYKHGVISPLIDPYLLRSVRVEIQEHLSFTEKETDIYKIFQSGDLANLDGLDNASLSRLPSLLQLRDALYSSKFREYLSSLTGSSKLSGHKTDMAINIYTEGCHLLCHDDVIGSRRLSYILYLSDPDAPWRPEWGGALRLYPTKMVIDQNGEDIKIPNPDHSLSISPGFNQLSFFTVQPGESFHDVEEVYHHPDNRSEKRIRMAISGWYHIPQEGEDGYEEGLEAKLADRSSLSQLQGRGDMYDQPQPQFISFVAEEDTVENSGGKGMGKEVMQSNDPEFTAADLDFLLKYIAPSYLTPDIAEELSETFANDSCLTLDRVLSETFVARLREYIEDQEKETLPESAEDIESSTCWKIARPPHKHRYLFQQPSLIQDGKSPIQELLDTLLSSRPFQKWLSLITGLSHIISCNILARRFRRGKDYTLASEYHGEEARLEFTIGLTPTLGWETGDGKGEDVGEEPEQDGPLCFKGEEPGSNNNGPAVGGYEIYMAGDDDDDDRGDRDNEDDVDTRLHTEMGKKKTKSDPAIYRSSSGANGKDDGGILFSMGAGWNRMSIVLRDSGTLKFVKYVSAAASGDRWDITGEANVVFDDSENEGEEGNEELEIEEEDDE